MSYIPVSSASERAAYRIAHKILAADTSHPSIGTPGRRKTAKVDQIATLVLEAIDEAIAQEGPVSFWSMEDLTLPKD